LLYWAQKYINVFAQENRMFKEENHWSASQSSSFLLVRYLYVWYYCSYLLKAAPDNKAVPCLLGMQLLRLMPRSNHHLRKWRENCRKMAAGGNSRKMARKFKT
jgi:hypothetical protein